MKNNFVLKNIICLSLLLLLGRKLPPDAAGYTGNKAIFVKNAEFTIIHRHNWSQATKESRRRMFWGDQNPFTSKNNYSHIESVNNANHDILFKTPTPALTYLFINEDSKYILGLSSIKLDNPYHLILLNNSGEILFYVPISPNEAKLNAKEFLVFEKKFPKVTKKLKLNKLIFKINDTYYLSYRAIPVGNKVHAYLFNFLEPSHFSRNFSESESNFIDWYKTPDPEIRLSYEKGKVSAISLLDPAGERFEIPVIY